MVGKVICTAGAYYPEEPRTFTWLENSLEVIKIIARSRTPNGRIFVVLASDGKSYEIFYNETEDAWQITPLEDLSGASR